MARIMRSDDRENTAGLSRTASMTSGPSGQVSPSATITLGLVDPTIPLLKLSTGRAALIGKERNSIPVFGAASGIGAAAGQAAQNVNPSRVFVDRLFRTDAAPAAPASPSGANDARAEATRLWTSSVGESADLAPADRTYLARLIASQTGISQADAEKRLNDVTVEAKAAADRARRGAAKLAFWLTASLFFGAFAATLAAVEGGQLRDGTWQDRRLIPRPWH